MSKNRSLTYLFIIVVGFFGFRVVKVIGSNAQGTPVPKPGTYEIGALLKTIQTNNPQGMFHTLIYNNGQELTNPSLLTISTTSHGTFELLDPNRSIAGSATINSALQGFIKTKLTTQVTLNTDPVLLAKLVAAHKVASTDANNYLQVLVYFTITDAQGVSHRLYLFEPCPATMVPSMAGQPGLNPANLYLQKLSLPS